MSSLQHCFRLPQTCCLLFAAGCLLLMPHLADANPMIVFHRTVDTSDPVEIKRLQPKPTTLAGMHEKGLFSFRIGETALSISYSPNKYPQQKQTDNTVLALRETPPISGISLAVSFSF